MNMYLKWLRNMECLAVDLREMQSALGQRSVSRPQIGAGHFNLETWFIDHQTNAAKVATRKSGLAFDIQPWAGLRGRQCEETEVQATWRANANHFIQTPA